MDGNNLLTSSNDSAMMTLSRQSNLGQAKPNPPNGPATASPKSIKMWWVGVSLPRFEERLAEDIRKAGADVFLPREQVTRYRKGKGRDTYARPIFPSYLFYRGDRDAAFESQVLLTVLNTTPKDCRDIDNLLLAHNAGPVRRSLFDGLGKGMKVKVVSGPARGVEGEVERFGDTRIYLGTNLGVAEIDVLQNQIEPFWGD